MAKINRSVLKWRKKQKRGAIMTPERFAQIKAEATRKYGSAERGEKAAGSAYWTTVKAKHRAAVRMRRKRKAA